MKKFIVAAILGTMLTFTIGSPAAKADGRVIPRRPGVYYRDPPYHWDDLSWYWDWPSRDSWETRAYPSYDSYRHSPYHGHYAYIAPRSSPRTWR